MASHTHNAVALQATEVEREAEADTEADMAAYTLETSDRTQP